MPQDPYRYFRVEARELLDQLGQTIMDLEKSASPEGVARMLRDHAAVELDGDLIVAGDYVHRVPLIVAIGIFGRVHEAVDAA